MGYLWDILYNFNKLPWPDPRPLGLIFKCSGLNWDTATWVSRIDEVICAGCGVCASICPVGAIGKKEVA